MIIRTSNSSGPSYEVRCDGCHSSFDADTGSFDRAREAMKARGWRTERNPLPRGVPLTPTQIARWPEWRHLCRACQQHQPSNPQTGNPHAR